MTLGLDRHDDGTESSPPKARQATAPADGIPNAVQLGGTAMGDGSTYGVRSPVSNGNHPYRYRGAVAPERKFSGVRKKWRDGALMSTTV